MVSDGLLDGSISCEECGAPLFFDGEHCYRHVQDLPQSRLRVLMKDQRCAEQVYKYLITLDFSCPEHGKQPNPFIWEVDKAQFYNHVATEAGALDLWFVLKAISRRK